MSVGSSKLYNLVLGKPVAGNAWSKFFYRNLSKQYTQDYTIEQCSNWLLMRAKYKYLSGLVSFTKEHVLLVIPNCLLAVESDWNSWFLKQKLSVTVTPRPFSESVQSGGVCNEVLKSKNGYRYKTYVRFLAGNR